MFVWRRYSPRLPHAAATEVQRVSGLRCLPPYARAGARASHGGSATSRARAYHQPWPGAPDLPGQRIQVRRIPTARLNPLPERPAWRLRSERPSLGGARSDSYYRLVGGSVGSSVSTLRDRGRCPNRFSPWCAIAPLVRRTTSRYSAPHLKAGADLSPYGPGALHPNVVRH
jgi:hypothetical protein